jgi:hypothetical protein
VKLLDAGRVDFVAEADYRKASKLSRRVELLLDAIIADIAYRREAFRVRRSSKRAGELSALTFHALRSSPTAASTRASTSPARSAARAPR